MRKKESKLAKVHTLPQISININIWQESLSDGHIDAARQGKQLVTSFQPELNDDTKIHEYWLKTIE